MPKKYFRDWSCQMCRNKLKSKYDIGQHWQTNTLPSGTPSAKGLYLSVHNSCDAYVSHTYHLCKCKLVVQLVSC